LNTSFSNLQTLLSKFTFVHSDATVVRAFVVKTGVKDVTDGVVPIVFILK